MPGSERCFVGKRRGHHSVPQPAPTPFLLNGEEASTVVRLKGGDPFLFGRGGEEAAYLAEHNIPVQVVPGVTAGMLLPPMPEYRRPIAALDRPSPS